jgi:hypothetical protein
MQKSYRISPNLYPEAQEELTAGQPGSWQDQQMS